MSSADSRFALWVAPFGCLVGLVLCVFGWYENNQQYNLTSVSLAHDNRVKFLLASFFFGCMFVQSLTRLAWHYGLRPDEAPVSPADHKLK